MIHVERQKVKIPDVLNDPSKAGKMETKKNLQFANKGQFSKMSFTAYRHSEVKEALIKLFNGKCAYCESKFLHIYPGDVEHFRPKGEIEDANPKQPGYYWLASDWDNLLFSCRNCNQQLKHSINNSKDKITLGKMNQFPLKNGIKHLRSHKANTTQKKLEDENRLLINPCKEDPEDYFKYDPIGIIKPKVSTGNIFEMANKSISVYALQRMPLVQAREKLFIEISAQIQRVLEAVENLNMTIGTTDLQTKRVIFDKILRREIIRLKKFMNCDEEYAGMARQIVNDFMNLNFPSI